jgi:hypothetical protein
MTLDNLRAEETGWLPWIGRRASGRITFPPPVLGWVGRPARAQFAPGGCGTGWTTQGAEQDGGDMEVRAWGRTQRDGTYSRVQGSSHRRGDFGLEVGCTHSGW